MACKGQDCSYAAKIGRFYDGDRFIRTCIITKIAGEVDVSPRLVRAWISDDDGLQQLGISQEILRKIMPMRSSTNRYGITIMDFFQDSRPITLEDLSLNLPNDLVRFGVTIKEYGTHSRPLTKEELLINNSDVQLLLFQALKKMWMAGIEHNDLHEQNILISKDRKAIRIIDFDRARLVDGKRINIYSEVCEGYGLGAGQFFYSLLCEAIMPKIRQDPILREFAD